VSLNVPLTVFPDCTNTSVVILPSIGSKPTHVPVKGSTTTGVTVAGDGGFFVAVGGGVSVGGIAVVGSAVAVGDGSGVWVEEGTAAVRVRLRARSVAAVAARSGVEVGDARMEVATAVAVASAG
jgi:hypothetical protein